MRCDGIILHERFHDMMTCLIIYFFQTSEMLDYVVLTAQVGEPANIPSAMVQIVSMFPSVSKFDNSYHYLVVTLACSSFVFITTTEDISHTYQVRVKSRCNIKLKHM